MSARACRSQRRFLEDVGAEILETVCWMHVCSRATITVTFYCPSKYSVLKQLFKSVTRTRNCETGRKNRYGQNGQVFCGHVTIYLRRHKQRISTGMKSSPTALQPSRARLLRVMPISAVRYHGRGHTRFRRSGQVTEPACVVLLFFLSCPG